MTPKRRALETALNGYKAAAAYNVAEVTTQATFEIAELYRQLAADLLASERPKNQTADVREQYDLMLEELATPIEEDAIKLHQENIAHAARRHLRCWREGKLHGPRQTAASRYGKTETPGSFHASLVLPVASPAADAPQPSARLVSQHERAVAQATAGQNADAELEFRQLMEAGPEFGGAAYNLGVLLAGLDRLEDAEAALLEAVRRTTAQCPGAG